MGILLASHVCPNCRIKNEEWEVDVDLGNKPLNRGAVAAKALKGAGKHPDKGGPKGRRPKVLTKDAVTMTAHATCAACGQSYTGTVFLDRPRGQGPVRFLNVEGPI